MLIVLNAWDKVDGDMACFILNVGHAEVKVLSHVVHAMVRVKENNKYYTELKYCKYPKLVSWQNPSIELFPRQNFRTKILCRESDFEELWFMYMTHGESKVIPIKILHDTELSANTCTLDQIYHKISEIFKYVLISIRDAFEKNRTVYSIFTAGTEEKTFLYARLQYLSVHTEDTVAVKLPEHMNKQLISINSCHSNAGSATFLCEQTCLFQFFVFGKKSVIWLKIYLPVFMWWLIWGRAQI